MNYLPQDILSLICEYALYNFFFVVANKKLYNIYNERYSVIIPRPMISLLVFYDFPTDFICKYKFFKRYETIANITKNYIRTKSTDELERSINDLNSSCDTITRTRIVELICDFACILDDLTIIEELFSHFNTYMYLRISVESLLKFNSTKIIKYILSNDQDFIKKRNNEYYPYIMNCKHTKLFIINNKHNEDFLVDTIRYYMNALSITESNNVIKTLTSFINTITSKDLQEFPNLILIICRAMLYEINFNTVVYKLLYKLVNIFIEKNMLDFENYMIPIDIIVNKQFKKCDQLEELTLLGNEKINAFDLYCFEKAIENGHNKFILLFIITAFYNVINDKLKYKGEIIRISEWIVNNYPNLINDKTFDSIKLSNPLLKNIWNITTSSYVLNTSLEAMAVLLIKADRKIDIHEDLKNYINKYRLHIDLDKLSDIFIVLTLKDFKLIEKEFKNDIDKFLSSKKFLLANSPVINYMIKKYKDKITSNITAILDRHIPENELLLNLGDQIYKIYMKEFTSVINYVKKIDFSFNITHYQYTCSIISFVPDFIETVYSKNKAIVEYFYSDMCAYVGVLGNPQARTKMQKLLKFAYNNDIPVDIDKIIFDKNGENRSSYPHLIADVIIILKKFDIKFKYIIIDLVNLRTEHIDMVTDEELVFILKNRNIFNNKHELLNKLTIERLNRILELIIKDSNFDDPEILHDEIRKFKINKKIRPDVKYISLILEKLNPSNLLKVFSLENKPSDKLKLLNACNEYMLKNNIKQENIDVISSLLDLD